ncbi:hypothetical protein TRFO_33614 [Tritrichomonas foetus]|uniref:Uncharacterized protein n=1 Tax=Tritrichomonas foetus TaxID=1144522 RepID=A0A1J4JL58_9EUKA|nr:hypothetical protein TRFO_33614 [Tritrichomonas foetus]|eukprot:OHS99830.1 hypothetical protein TRFO_33614 [Tritrichomonas foetus]
MKLKAQNKKANQNKIDFKSYVGKGYQSFASIKIPKVIKSIDFSYNPIKNFEGLGQNHQLVILKCDNTSLESFKGAEIQVSLLQFSCLNSPLAKSKLLQVMSLVVFGQSLNSVNGHVILQKNREIALKIGDQAKVHLLRGFILSSADPLMISRPGQKDSIAVDLTVDEFLQREKKLQSNNEKLEEMRKRLKELKEQKKIIDELNNPNIFDPHVTPTKLRAKGPRTSPRLSPKQRMNYSNHSVNDSPSDDKNENYGKEIDEILEKENDDIQIDDSIFDFDDDDDNQNINNKNRNQSERRNQSPKRRGGKKRNLNQTTPIENPDDILITEEDKIKMRHTPEKKVQFMNEANGGENYGNDEIVTSTRSPNRKSPKKTNLTHSTKVSSPSTHENHNENKELPKEMAQPNNNQMSLEPNQNSQQEKIEINPAENTENENVNNNENKDESRNESDFLADDVIVDENENTNDNENTFLDEDPAISAMQNEIRGISAPQMFIQPTNNDELDPLLDF